MLKNRCLSIVLTFAMLGVSVLMPQNAIAGPVPSSLGVQASARQADVDRIRELLGDPGVLEALQRAGTDPAELDERLHEMNDHDVHLLASRMDDVKSGGIIVEVLVIVVLVLLVLYLMKRV